MTTRDLRIELRAEDAGALRPLVLVPQGSTPPESVGGEAAVLAVSAGGLELRPPEGGGARALNDAWTSVAGWRVRCSSGEERGAGAEERALVADAGHPRWQSAVLGVLLLGLALGVVRVVWLVVA